MTLQMTVWCIYKHTNRINGKCYVGQTRKKNPKERWNNGKNYSERSQPKFQNAIKKYGWKQFDHEILAYTYAQETADMLEDYWIVQYDTIASGYNVLGGGISGKHSDESKKKMSASKQGEKNNFYGKKHSKETRQKMSIKAIGRLHSEETKKKMSESKKGTHKSEEEKKKISERQLGPNNHMYGKTPWNKGKSFSSESRAKMSKAHKGKKPWNKGKKMVNK